MPLPLFKIRASAASIILGQKGLGVTGQTYCENWVKSHLYGYRKEFSNKYVRKGLATEEQGIDLVSRVTDRFLTKHVGRVFNDYAEGECDIQTKRTIEDIKNSWDAYTFPLFEKEPNPVYVAQGKTYLWLYDKEEFKLHYCLNDAPEDEINRQYWFKHKDLGLSEGEVNEALFEEVRSKMIHSHLPDHLRLKTYTIKRDPDFEKLLTSRVLECRKHILSLK